jgi:hypothetical protein
MLRDLQIYGTPKKRRRHLCYCGNGLCVCLLLQYLLQSCSRGGRGIVEDMCYENSRDDEPRP